MQLAPHFSAKTDISSIGPVDAEYSQVFSALRLFEITPHLFLNLSIAQLRNGELFETAIEDKNIVDETESPFYLRGYEAIEKEIALIASRTDKTPIIANLVTLKRQRRKIAQDNTIEQALAHFQLTPVVTGEQFVAMSMGIAKTEFTYDNNNRLMLVLSMVIGGFIGTLFVMISTALRQRKEAIA